MYISKMEKKFHKRFLLFLDNCILIRSPKFQIVQREYLSPAVNVLTKSGKISNITNKKGFLGQFLSETQHNLMKDSHGDFTSICDLRTCWLLNGGMKRGYLDVCVNIHFTICNFQNTQITTVKLVWKCLKFDVDSRNWIKY